MENFKAALAPDLSKKFKGKSLYTHQDKIRNSLCVILIADSRWYDLFKGPNWGWRREIKIGNI
jgi:hypothetical protein